MEASTGRNRVAIVTGAAGGIGAAVCAILERRGWSIVPVDRIEIDHPAAIQVDIADHLAVDAALRALPRADALVNNAAIQLYKPLIETTVAEWDAVAAVNLRGPFVCLNALHTQLVASRGAVVNVASVHAFATSSAIGAYAASKGGLVAFTRAAALEMSEYGVRVNAIVPGATDTPALRDGLKRSPGAKEMLQTRTPLRRIGEALEVAEAVEFLIDGTRSSFITGQCLAIDGGALARLGTE